MMACHSACHVGWGRLVLQWGCQRGGAQRHSEQLLRHFHAAVHAELLCQDCLALTAQCLEQLILAVLWDPCKM